mmetsp:Transcript_1046/g.1889  ORF Transcript_1046/g.1889 Transcript_1046/m.1889 type:complete len:167 (+) Transcript_1046:142-642(+)
MQGFFPCCTAISNLRSDRAAWQVMVENAQSGGKWRQVGTWFPANSNSQQTFHFQDVSLPDRPEIAQPAAAVVVEAASPSQATTTAPLTADSAIRASDGPAGSESGQPSTGNVEGAGKASDDCKPTQPAPAAEPQCGVRAQALRLVMTDSTDFFGRVVVYALDVLGQ